MMDLDPNPVTAKGDIEIGSTLSNKINNVYRSALSEKVIIIDRLVPGLIGLPPHWGAALIFSALCVTA
jgi:hypothetical protein